jgi:phosphoadenosine phosphosulfate reductase
MKTISFGSTTETVSLQPRIDVSLENEASQILSETRGYGPEELLRYVLKRFGDKIAFASSFGAEDQVLTDMLCKVSSSAKIFTLDTGRLHEATYKLAEATRKKYNIGIKVLFPDYQQVEKVVAKHGFNLFYDSIENRKLCCQVRKTGPLKRELSTLNAWICGLRKEQSPTRCDINTVEWDKAFGLIKVCPLINWSEKDVWEYIRANNVPYNELHDGGFPSIGCEPCTRAICAGEDVRAGRWWWELPEHKECGLHAKHPPDYQI